MVSACTSSVNGSVITLEGGGLILFVMNLACECVGAPNKKGAPF